MPPDPIAELVQLAEDDLANFELRMQKVSPCYELGDRVELHGEVFEVTGIQVRAMPGYWLKGRNEKLFLPTDWEIYLRPVVH